MDRRTFVGALVATSTAAMSEGTLGKTLFAPAAGDVKATEDRLVLRTFDYSGVRLRPGRWQKQYADGRDAYFNVSNDDILHGFRAAAGMAAPGKPLGGWCATNSYIVFGQWLMAMSHASRATDDGALRDKASVLVSEWGKTLTSDKNLPGNTYEFEKMVGGLLDMHVYGGSDASLGLLETMVDAAIARKPATLHPAENLTTKLTDGLPIEWYTLAENLFRAYQVTGKSKYKEFAEFWLYPQYWDKFIDTSTPADVHGFHAYSHLNTLSSAAMTYGVSGDRKYLKAIQNGYDYWQKTQCYATGGWGPAEKTMPYDGALGDALEIRIDTFETACGSWAVFKISKYLMEFTGEARYGDWIERLLYNGIGAALPITTGGRNFYYSSYHVGSALKAYDQSTFTCCSGTYFLDIAEYHNLIYFQDGNGLYVNLYVPSEVTWERGNSEVKLVQETSYPETETVTLRLETNDSVNFPLSFRVPEWATGVTVKVNGAEQQIEARPGSWAAVTRTWQNGDTVEIRIPLEFRRVPVDAQHPDRVAIMRGPVVLAQDVQHDPLPAIPKDDRALAGYFKPDPNRPAVFLAQDDLPCRGVFRPFYSFGEGERYRIYFDPKLRRQLW